jgi:hypothetical protein
MGIFRSSVLDLQRKPGHHYDILSFKTRQKCGFFGKEHRKFRPLYGQLIAVLLQKVEVRNISS